MPGHDIAESGRTSVGTRALLIVTAVVRWELVSRCWAHLPSSPKVLLAMD